MAAKHKKFQKGPRLNSLADGYFISDAELPNPSTDNRDTVAPYTMRINYSNNSVDIVIYINNIDDLDTDVLETTLETIKSLYREGLDVANISVRQEISEQQ